MTRVLTSAGQADSLAIEREIIRRRDGVNRSTAVQTSTVVETPQFTPSSDGKTFAEQRRTSLHRRRVVGFFVCIPLWALSAIPLARLLMEGREGADPVLLYLAVGAISLGIAAAIRGVYAMLTKRKFWAPSMFLIAAFIAIAGYGVQGMGEEVPAVTAPARESSAD